MDAFVSHIVISGVLCFVGGMIAWLANRARTMGAPPVGPRIAFGVAVAILITAVGLVVSGIHALPDEDHPPAPPPGQASPRDFVDR